MIEIDHITFAYAQNPVLRDLSVSIGDGDFCTILGPNGSGKTTLLKAIAGLLKVEGNIRLRGSDLSLMSARELSTILAYVPQRLDVVFDFSVFDTVMLGRNPYQSRWAVASRRDVEVVNEMLRKNGLWELRDRMLTQLSGGEVQRVLIARAMAQQTPLLLLDEPLSNLDVGHKYEVLDVLRQLNRDFGTTIVMILHDFSFAKQFSKSILLLKDGTVEDFGPAPTVLSQENIRRTFNLSERFSLDGNGNVVRSEISL